MKLKTALLLPIIIPALFLTWLMIGYTSFMYWITGDSKWL
jgi:hypothetical protein